MYIYIYTCDIPPPRTNRLVFTSLMCAYCCTFACQWQRRKVAIGAPRLLDFADGHCWPNLLHQLSSSPWPHKRILACPLPNPFTPPPLKKTYALSVKQIAACLGSNYMKQRRPSDNFKRTTGWPGLSDVSETSLRPNQQDPAQGDRSSSKPSPTNNPAKPAPSLTPRPADAMRLA